VRFEVANQNVPVDDTDQMPTLDLGVVEKRLVVVDMADAPGCDDCREEGTAVVTPHGVLMVGFSPSVFLSKVVDNVAVAHLNHFSLP
jgi:hypothetical protein